MTSFTRLCDKIRWGASRWRRFIVLSLALGIVAPLGQTAAASSAEVEIRGTLELQIADDFDSGSSRLFASLHSQSGRQDVRFPGGLPVNLAGKSVRVSGQLQDGVVSVSAISAEDLEGPSSALQAQAAETLGEQRTLVTLVNFLNDPSEPFTASAMDWEILDEANPDSAASYYREASYEATWLTGQVLGWFALSWDDTACSVWTSAGTQQVLDAIDPFVDFSMVDRWIIVTPANPNCGFSGISTLGKLAYNTADGVVQMSRVIVNNAGFLPNRIAAHELGHSIASLQHSADYECGGTVVEDDCNPTGLGSLTDRYDVMGHYPMGGHFSSPNKEQLGWLSGRVVDVVAPGGTFALAPYETTEPGTKVLRIRVSWVLDDLYGSIYYYVSYRQLIGFDGVFPELSSPGAMVHLDARRFVGGAYGRSRLLDATPHVDPDSGSQSSDSSDVTVKIGEAFVDSDHGVTVSVLGLSGGELEVSVSVSQYCGNLVADEGIGEACDGTDLRGNSCESIGYGEGVLACTSACEFDTDGCGMPRCGPNHSYDPVLELCNATLLSDAADVSLWQSAPTWAEVREFWTANNLLREGGFVIHQTPDRSWIYRFSLPFDTSSIPDSGPIVSAELSFKVRSIEFSNTHPSSADQLVLVRTTLAGPPQTVPDDFDQFGSLNDPVEGAGRIDVSEAVVPGETSSFVLNGDGLSWIDPRGWTTLGVRAGYDVDDVTIPGEEPRLSLYFRTSESPVAGPKLIVRYAPRDPVVIMLGGNAQGGQVFFTVEGVALAISTSAGLTLEQVAVSMALAILQDSSLQALGVTAESTGPMLSTNGSVTGLSTTDPGILFNSSAPVPAMSPVGLAALVAMLAGLAVRAARLAPASKAGGNAER